MSLSCSSSYLKRIENGDDAKSFNDDGSPQVRHSIALGDAALGD